MPLVKVVLGRDPAAQARVRRAAQHLVERGQRASGPEHGPGRAVGLQARRLGLFEQEVAEPVVDLEEEVGVGTGVELHVRRQRADPPVRELVALVGLERGKGLEQSSE